MREKFRKDIKVGFIGLGLMGSEMAYRLLMFDYPLVIWNRTSKKITHQNFQLATVATSPAELARVVDIVCLCLTDEKAVEAVLFGKEGLADAKHDIMILDHSTLSSENAVEIGNRAKLAGMRYIDAPITGSVPGAREGTLSIFAGGIKPYLKTVKPILSCYATHIHDMGALGNGQATKLCNQIMLFNTLIATYETLNFSKHCGLESKKLIEVLSSNTLIDSKAWRIFSNNAITPKYEKLAHIKDVLKDSGYIQATAAKHGAHLRLTSQTIELFRQLVDSGHGDDGLTAIHNLYL